MSSALGLFRALNEEWQREGGAPDARAALQRWAATTPGLAEVGSPAALVQRCHERNDVAVELLAAVVAEAADDIWATRTVLQAVLPGLRAVARRTGCYVGGPRPVWQSHDELHQDVVCIAVDRIRAVASAVPAFPCRVVIDGTWQRLRHHAQSVRADCGRRVPLAEMGDRVAVPERSAVEELGLAIMDAVDRSVLDPFDAGLVYSCHVVGYGIAELAAATGRNERTLWRRRRRAEELLAADAKADTDAANNEHARGQQEAS